MTFGNFSGSIMRVRYSLWAIICVCMPMIMDHFYVQLVEALRCTKNVAFRFTKYNLPAEMAISAIQRCHTEICLQPMRIILLVATRNGLKFKALSLEDG